MDFQEIAEVVHIALYIGPRDTVSGDFNFKLERNTKKPLPSSNSFQWCSPAGLNIPSWSPSRTLDTEWKMRSRISLKQEILMSHQTSCVLFQTASFHLFAWKDFHSIKSIPNMILLKWGVYLRLGIKSHTRHLQCYCLTHAGNHW